MTARLARPSATQPEPTINVTPLVDVVLVLLIIFMVITPALAEGEQITLPEVLQADEKPRDMNPIEVMVTFHDTVLVDKATVPEAELGDRIRALQAEDPERTILLQADARLPYVEVRERFALLQKLGFTGISLKVIEKKGTGG
jgi:biopolymer transport protein TolR